MNPNHCDSCRLVALLMENINEKKKLINEFKKQKRKKDNPGQQKLDFDGFNLN